MADCNPTIPIKTLNVYGLNTHIKRQRLSDWIKKKKYKKETLNYTLFTRDTF